MSDKIHNQKVNRPNQKKMKGLNNILSEIKIKTFKKIYVVSLEAAIY